MPDSGQRSRVALAPPDVPAQNPGPAGITGLVEHGGDDVVDTVDLGLRVREQVYGSFPPRLPE